MYNKKTQKNVKYEFKGHAKAILESYKIMQS